MRIPLGPWRPDADPLAAPQGVVLDVSNAIPAAGGWLPQRGLLNATSHVLEGNVQGIWTSTRLSGDIELFVAVGGRIWRVPGRALALVDVSGGSVTAPFSTAASTRWRTVQYGDTIVAVNFENATQAYDLRSGGSFLPLAAAAPRARYAAVVRDFTVLGHTADDSDGVDAYRVQWHGFVDGLPDVTEWTPTASNQADFQRLADIGQVQGLTGGAFGTIVGESGVSLMEYGGALFQFSTRERRIGTRVPNSVNQYRQLTAWWSPEGWAAFDGSGVQMIGSEKVDRWFAADFIEVYKDAMWAATDNGRGHMLWAYCGRGSTGTLNRLLRYSVPLNEWSKSEIAVEALGQGKTFSRTLDDAEFDNLDTFAGNLDDPALWTSLPQTLAVHDGRISGFQGDPMTAVFETPEFQLAQDGNRAILNRADVLGEGGAASISIFSRTRFDRGGTWSKAHTRRSDGQFRFVEAGRSNRARVTRSGNWATTSALDIWGVAGGR